MKYNTQAASHATLSVVGLPADPECQILVRGIHGLSDKAGSVVTLRAGGTIEYTLDAAAVASQAVVPLASTTGLAQNDHVLIQQKDHPFVFERRVVTSVSAGVSATMTANLTNTYASGDLLYELSSLGTIACGAAAINAGAGIAVFAGEIGRPVGIDLDSTSAGNVTMFAEYIEG